MKKVIFYGGRLHDMWKNVADGCECLVVPSPGKEDSRYAFSGYHAVDGTEVWSQGGAVIRDAQNKSRTAK